MYQQYFNYPQYLNYINLHVNFDYSIDYASLVIEDEDFFEYENTFSLDLLFSDDFYFFYIFYS